MVNIIYKPMETDDEIVGKAYVHYKSWQETYGGLVDKDYLNNVTLDKCKNVAFKWRDNIIVAKDGDKVVGFVGYGECNDPNYPNHGEIFGLYVLREYQGKKIGFDLMNAAVCELDNFPNIALWVLQGNEKAISFYEKYGFRFDGNEQEIKLGTTNKELRMVFDNEHSRKNTKTI